MPAPAPPFTPVLTQAEGASVMPLGVSGAQLPAPNPTPSGSRTPPGSHSGTRALRGTHRPLGQRVLGTAQPCPPAPHPGQGGFHQALCVTGCRPPRAGAPGSAEINHHPHQSLKLPRLTPPGTNWERGDGGVTALFSPSGTMPPNTQLQGTQARAPACR